MANVPNNAPNGVSCTLIYGCHHYGPTIVKDKDCGSNMRLLSEASQGYQKDRLEVSANSHMEKVSFNLADFNALQSRHLKDKHFTECHLFKRKSTLNRGDGSPSFIYERDEKQWSEQEIERITWFPRIQMFCAAFKCVDIFAVSIVPKDPSIKQTWYLKKTLIHDPCYAYCESGEEINNRYENTDGSEPRDPRPEDFKGGFIKPFETYYSDGCRATIDLSNLPSTVQSESLSNQQDVERIVGWYYPEKSQEAIKSILNQFLLDSEATHVGLLTLNPHQQWVFWKR